MTDTYKPIYVFVDKYDDMIHLTKEELEELLQQAWEQGYRRGMATPTYPNITTTPAIQPYYATPIQDPKWEWNTITCNNDVTSELRILC